MLRTTLTAEAIDDVLAGTFPASDPPAWTSGITRPAPVSRPAVGRSAACDDTTAARASDVVDVSRPLHSERTVAQGLVSLLGATGLALLVPLAILAVGTPVALVGRGVVAVTGWILASIR